jgi:thiol:disulfide interchange protein
MGKQIVRRYDQVGRLTRWLNATCGFLLTLLGIALVLFAPAQDQWAVRLVGIAAAAVAGFLMVRWLRSQTIEVTGHRVVLRGLLRTAKLAVADIDHFVVVVQNDAPASRTKALAVRTRDGKTIEFDDFLSDGSDANSIDRLVELLNQDVAETSLDHVRAAAA